MKILKCPVCEKDIETVDDAAAVLCKEHIEITDDSSTPVD